MSTITFDTLEFVKRLRSAGFTESQAEAMAVAQRESLAQAMDNSVATKADVLAVKNDLDALRTQVDSRFEALEMRLTIKLGAFLAVAVGVLVTLLKH